MKLELPFGGRARVFRVFPESHVIATKLVCCRVMINPDNESSKIFNVVDFSAVSTKIFLLVEVSRCLLEVLTFCLISGKCIV